MGKYRFLVDTPGGLAEFRKDYNIPDDVHLSLANLDTIPWGNPGFDPFTLLSIIETGLRFPVQPLLCEFLRQTRICPTQLSTNSYRIINSIAELNRRAGINLGLAELFHQYSIGSKEDGWVYYLRIRCRWEKIIQDTSDKDLNDDDFFWVSGNFEDQETQIPGDRINWNKGTTGIITPALLHASFYFGFLFLNRTDSCLLYADSAHLKSLYSYPNLNTLRATLRYLERSWAKLLNFEPTYRHSSRRKARVTNFLLEASPEPDPTMPQINLVRTIAEKEMAKRNRVRALLTETHPTEVPPTTQTQETVVALPSQQPTSSRPSKRARTTQTEQCLVNEDETILPLSPPASPQLERSDRASSSKWAPKISFQNCAIRDTDSVVVDKDHMLAFNLAKSVCLPLDMENHNQLTELKAIRSATKSMILVSSPSGLSNFSNFLLGFVISFFPFFFRPCKRVKLPTSVCWSSEKQQGKPWQKQLKNLPS